MIRVGQLLDPNNQCRPTIQTTGLFSSIVVLRALFAVADRLQSSAANTSACKILLNGVRTPFSESQVVLGRADVAGVTFNLDRQVGVVLEGRHDFIKNASGAGA